MNSKLTASRAYTEVIPEELYKNILASVPIACVDVIVRMRGRIILVQRENEPLKGFWWLPGGRINRGETAIAAAARKVRADVGLSIANTTFIGYYEDQFETGPFSIAGHHTISLVFEAESASEQI